MNSNEPRHCLEDFTNLSVNVATLKCKWTCDFKCNWSSTRTSVIRHPPQTCLFFPLHDPSPNIFARILLSRSIMGSTLISLELLGWRRDWRRFYRGGCLHQGTQSRCSSLRWRTNPRVLVVMPLLASEDPPHEYKEYNCNPTTVVERKLRWGWYPMPVEEGGEPETKIFNAHIYG